MRAPLRHRWKGIFITWIVIKEKGAGAYSRYDMVAWGNPVKVNTGRPTRAGMSIPPSFCRRSGDSVLSSLRNEIVALAARHIISSLHHRGVSSL